MIPGNNVTGFQTSVKRGRPTRNDAMMIPCPDPLHKLCFLQPKQFSEPGFTHEGIYTSMGSDWGPARYVSWFRSMDRELDVDVCGGIHCAIRARMKPCTPKEITDKSAVGTI